MIHESWMVANARRLALRDSHTHDYLPKTLSQAEEFRVHRWVIDAMEWAYKEGVKDASARSLDAAEVHRDYGAAP